MGTKQVPVGTQVGLFHCGADGQWHFGWFVNAIGQPTGPTRPVISASAGQIADPNQPTVSDQP